jgi:hypothetical protein
LVSQRRKLFAGTNQFNLQEHAILSKSRGENTPRLDLLLGFAQLQNVSLDIKSEFDRDFEAPFYGHPRFNYAWGYEVVE